MDWDTLGWLVFGLLMLWFVVMGLTSDIRKRLAELEARVERLERSTGLDRADDDDSETLDE